MEKSPRFLESEENLGALNPIGSEEETINIRLRFSLNTGRDLALPDEMNILRTFAMSQAVKSFTNSCIALNTELF